MAAHTTFLSIEGNTVFHEDRAVLRDDPVTSQWAHTEPSHCTITHVSDARRGQGSTVENLFLSPVLKI